MKILSKSLLYILAATFIMSSCSKDDEPEVENTDPNAELKSDIQDNFAALVYANYQEAYTDAENLQAAINDFTQNPTETSFEEAKQVWLSSRETYGQTEAFRFSGGPIDDENGPEGLINSWPLDEAYIDYISFNGEIIQGGIINDAENYPSLTADALMDINQPNDEESKVSTGYHAIEFLLWGQDLTNPSEMQPGMRSFTDYVDGSEATNQSRRRDYLNACAELLVINLKKLVDEWAPGSNNYRKTFTSQSANDALQQMLTGAGVLTKSELSGERVFTAYDEQDQEQEHSCFSDNTHRDIRANTYGIKNVLTGKYNAVNGSNSISGPSIIDLLHIVKPTFAVEFEEQLDKAVAAVDATGIPFDNAINDPALRPAILESVVELQTLGDMIAEAGTILNLSINTDLPE